MKKFIISIIMLFTVFSVKADEVEPLYVVVSCAMADRFVILLKQTNGDRERIIRPHDFDFRIGDKIVVDSFGSPTIVTRSKDERSCLYRFMIAERYRLGVK